MLTSVIRGAVFALCASVTAAVPSLTIEGSDFVNPATGYRFQIVGAAYQPGGSAGYDPASGVDPLSDGSVCLRDAALLQRLGVNAIRVYNVDPTLNHDECASIFNTVGIYMLIDVNSPLAGQSIDQLAPSTSYDASYLNRTFGVIEAFKDYPNTLLFFAGNEVINDIATGAIDPPYMRAVTRDLKNYIAKHSSRAIPVAYSAADVRPILVDTWNYLQCTTTGNADDPSRVDVFALNSYSWCGYSTFTTSTYDVLVEDFTNTSVPVFFSEYGCNVPSPRVFTEVPVIYGPLMDNVLSGALVYEYSEQVSDYGLVNISSDGSVQILPDYDTLQTRFNSLNITALQDVKATNTTIDPPTCTSTLIQESGFSNNFTIPAVPPGAQELIDNGIANPNNGKIVAVTTTKVSQVVTAVNGDVLEDLAIVPLPDDVFNNPGDVNGTSTDSSSSTTSAAPAATTTKKSAAVKMQFTMSGLVLVGLLAVGWISI